MHLPIKESKQKKGKVLDGVVKKIVTTMIVFVIIIISVLSFGGAEILKTTSSTEYIPIKFENNVEVTGILNGNTTIVSLWEFTGKLEESKLKRITDFIKFSANIKTIKLVNGVFYTSIKDIASNYGRNITWDDSKKIVIVSGDGLNPSVEFNIFTLNIILKALLLSLLLIIIKKAYPYIVRYRKFRTFDPEIASGVEKIEEISKSKNISIEQAEKIYFVHEYIKVFNANNPYSRKEWIVGGTKVTQGDMVSFQDDENGYIVGYFIGLKPCRAKGYTHNYIIFKNNEVIINAPVELVLEETFQKK